MSTRQISLIKKISIKNIRGINNLKIKCDIVPNKPNVIVAPNGSGKTSIAKAFKSLKQNKIILDNKNDYYQINDENKPSISIILDNDDEFIANEIENTINKKFKIHVIDNRIKPIEKGKGSQFSKADLKVEPIVLYGTIPEKRNNQYHFSELKKQFGNCGKIITNFSGKISEIFLVLFSEQKQNFDSFKLKRRDRKIGEFLEMINSFIGTKNEYLNKDFDFSTLTTDKNFEQILNVVMNIKRKGITPDLEDILDSIQLIFYINSIESKEQSKLYKYLSYTQKKQELKAMIDNLNSSWKNFVLKEIKKKKLILEFPNPNDISNGERDIISIFGKLAEIELKMGENNLLIIDEVFDYLDDANIIAVQYFLNKLFKKAKRAGKKIYSLILTHLDPQYFKTFSFDPKRVYYLDENSKQVNSDLHEIFSKRSIIDNVSNSDFSRYYLHFHPEDYVPNNEIIAQLHEKGVNVPNAVSSQEFYQIASDELNKYLSEKKYDKYFVCVALRINFEQNIYNKLTDETKAGFLETHKTNKKLDFAEEQNIEINDIYRLLGIIYNEALHLKGCEYKNIAVEHKLRNKAIKTMIIEVMKELQIN